jgi:hypothetical protein
MIECRREQEVLDAIAAGRWPARVDGELTAHAAGCEVCGELAEAASAIAAEHDAAWAHARVPSSAHVWWRAQMRARREAARAAATPITLVQGMAAASAAGVLAAGAGYASRASWWPPAAVWPGWRLPLPDASSGLAALRDTATAIAAGVASLPHVEMVGAACLVLLLMPAAFYFVLSEK